MLWEFNPLRPWPSRILWPGSDRSLHWLLRCNSWQGSSWICDRWLRPWRRWLQSSEREINWYPSMFQTRRCGRIGTTTCWDKILGSVLAFQPIQRWRTRYLGTKNRKLIWSASRSERQSRCRRLGFQRRNLRFFYYRSRVQQDRGHCGMCVKTHDGVYRAGILGHDKCNKTWHLGWDCTTNTTAHVRLEERLKHPIWRCWWSLMSGKTSRQPV